MQCEYENDGVRITAPGKFEGQPVFAPYFWDLALDGMADREEGAAFVFFIPKDDGERNQWPTLSKWLGRSRTLRLKQNDQGFVLCY
jgi:hypothetical protein